MFLSAGQDLVSAIDLALQDRKTPTALRHRALQLALVVVSTVGQGSLVAYFLRRDLFSTLVSFIADEETKPFAFEATLLLGLLANYRKCEARNPYGVRIEDFVEEGVMEVRRILLSLCFFFPLWASTSAGTSCSTRDIRGVSSTSAPCIPV